MNYPNHYSVNNKTKWLELRNFILSLSPTVEWPQFRSKYLPNGYIHSWDREWVHHFWDGGFKGIEWFELKGFHQMNSAEVDKFLKIGLAGEARKTSLRLYGYAPNGSEISLLTKDDLIICGWY